MKILTVLNRQNVSKYGLGAVASAALLSSNANAALDVSAALTGNDASSNIETGITWVLSIAVLIFGGRKVIGFFNR